MANKIFSIVSVKKRKAESGYQLVCIGTNGQRYLSRGETDSIQMLEENRINLGGRKWRLFSSLDEERRLELLDFFRSLPSC